MGILSKYTSQLAVFEASKATAKIDTSIESRKDVSSSVHIEVRGLKKRFGEHDVLRGISLDILRGKINVVVGGSGAGKTVLMKHLVGLIRPDSGQINVDGVDIARQSERELNQTRLSFGMAFQYAALFDSMTVEENLIFPLMEHRKDKYSKKEMRALVSGRLEDLGLPGIMDRMPMDLSGGMRKRVGFVRATILEPSVIFYDEPTTGLDPVATKQIDDMIANISRKQGVTSVVISHDMASTFRIADQIALLEKGAITQVGTPVELRKNPAGQLAQFLEISGV